MSPLRAAIPCAGASAAEQDGAGRIAARDQPPGRSPTRHDPLRLPALPRGLQGAPCHSRSKGPCPNCGQRLQIPEPDKNKTVLAAPVQPEVPTSSAVPASASAPSPPSVEVLLDVQPAGPQPIPRFIHGGVLVACPGCDSVHRVWTEEYGQVIPCECGEDFRVIVAPEGDIPLRCKTCGCNMFVPEQSAGQDVSCLDCKETLRVPNSPIVVRRVRPVLPGPISSGTGYSGYVAPGRSSYSPRKCVICGRYLRNPTPFCYRCRPWK